MGLTNNEPCPSCGRYGNRGVSIDAVVIDGGRILLIKRKAEPFKGYWALPGGYVEWGESAEDAAARKLREELGLVADACRLVGVYSSPDRHPKQVINIAFRVQASGTPKAGDDALEYKWFGLDDLPEEMAFDHKRIIADSRQ